MDTGFVAVITSAIGFAGRVLNTLTLKVDQPATPPPPVIPAEGSGMTSSDQPANTKLVFKRERFTDKAFINDVIDEATRHFSEIQGSPSEDIVRELRKQRVGETVQELQTRVGTLSPLLSTGDLDQDTYVQLLMTAVNPLQVSLEIARLRFDDYGAKDVWQCCYIIVTAALMSGYAFLGQDIPQMRDELKTEMHKVQTELLNDIASKIFPARRDFPWDRVPILLSPEGAQELGQFYAMVFDPGSIHTSPFETGHLTIGQIRDVVGRMEDKEGLEKMLASEQGGKARAGAIDAIERQISRLQPPVEVTPEEPVP